MEAISHSYSLNSQRLDPSSRRQMTEFKQKINVLVLSTAVIVHCTSACVRWSHSLPALVCCSMTTKQQRLRVGDWEQCCKVYTSKAK